MRIHDIEYHRNGVGGDSFYVVQFEEPETGLDLLAMIPSQMRDFDEDLRCYIINPSDPMDSKWRGDRLYRRLVDAGLWDLVQAKNDALLQTLAEVTA